MIRFYNLEYGQNYQQVQVITHNKYHGVFAHIVKVHGAYRLNSIILVFKVNVDRLQE
jgi:hypothetical protein